MRAYVAVGRLWLVAALFVVAVAACSTDSTISLSPETTTSVSTEDEGGALMDGGGDGVEIPDATYGDGADAVDAVESEGLTATLIDANDGYDFDSTRDVTGCEVVDQYPAAGDLVDDGGEVDITVDCSQVDWENQEGAGWDAFNEAYAVAFDDGCRALFGEPPDGSLYEDDYEYTVIDCQNLNPGDGSGASDLPGDVPDDPEGTGIELGELDGCRALFDQQGVYSLNWGTHSVTAYDCPIGGYTPPAKKRKTRTDGCSGGQADGTPIGIEVKRGRVNCAGAEALWNEFLRRAPTEGQGSSGVLELDGWICAGAVMSDAPRAGSCSRADKSAEFVVFNGE